VAEADDYEPVAAPAPRRRQLREDPEERPLLAEAQSAAVHDDLGDDLPDDDEDEDSYLAELRKAMTDDEPLGPRDDEDDDGYGSSPPAGRSRFGRRR
jgi:hypothetical protein